MRTAAHLACNMDFKSDANPTTQEAAPSTMASFSKSSVRDVNDMRRMGKVQELKASSGTRMYDNRSVVDLMLLQRYFGPWAIVGFASILGCAWEYALMYVQPRALVSVFADKSSAPSFSLCRMAVPPAPSGCSSYVALDFSSLPSPSQRWHPCQSNPHQTRRWLPDLLTISIGRHQPEASTTG